MFPQLPCVLYLFFSEREMNAMELLFDILLLILGIYWDVTAFTKLPIWRGTSIAGGLIPAVASTIMIILLLYRIFQRFRSGEMSGTVIAQSFREFDWKGFLPILIGICIIFVSKVLGLYITLAVMLFLWLKILSKCSVVRALVMTVIVMAVIYGIFIAWLHVPLPKGMLGII